VDEGKSMAPKVIWFPSIFELLLDESEKTIKFMIWFPSIFELMLDESEKTIKLTRVNSANVLDEGLRIGERGRQMNSKVKIQTNKAKLNAC
jgi:hypothetical protein